MQSEKEPLEWLEFDLLNHFPELVHASFLRQGGTSEGSFASLNLSDSVGDSPEHLRANRHIVKEALALPEVVYARQEHGVNIHQVFHGSTKIPAADALFTTEKNLGLAITHADCQAALFFDPKREVIAAAHAGWKGLASGIYPKLIEKLKEIGVEPHDLFVCISPSLGPQHAEMKNYEKELPKELWDFQVKPNYFDFWQIAKAQLLQAGIDGGKIEIVQKCTYSDPKSFFSHRREKKGGRHATVIAQKG